MGTTSITSTAGGARVVAHDRRVDVTDLRAARVAAYARRQPGTECYLERRGARTYLVAPDR